MIRFSSIWNVAVPGCLVTLLSGCAGFSLQVFPKKEGILVEGCFEQESDAIDTAPVTPEEFDSLLELFEPTRIDWGVSLSGDASSPATANVFRTGDFVSVERLGSEPDCRFGMDLRAPVVLHVTVGDKLDASFVGTVDAAGPELFEAYVPPMVSDDAKLSPQWRAFAEDALRPGGADIQVGIDGTLENLQFRVTGREVDLWIGTFGAPPPADP